MSNEKKGNFKELVRDRIKSERNQNPLVGMQVCSDVVYATVQDILTREQGVRAEDLLACLASMAGFSAVYDLVLKIDAKEIEVATPEVAVLGLSGGGTAYSGDYINRRIAEQKISVWSLAAGTTQELLGTSDFIDFVNLDEIFSRVASSVGSEHFGTPDLPEKHMCDIPQNFIKYFFPVLHRMLSEVELPVEDYFGTFAFALQPAITNTKEVLDPKMALKIVMEYSIPASKVDPKSILPKEFF